MKILVIGGGGREHAVCYSLSKSSSVKEIICAPGNVGIAEIAKCIDIGVTQIDELVGYALNNGVDLTVVGPEASLALGVVDAFQREGLPIVGPTRAAAKLESSKSFAKEIMREAHVPTADYRLCKNRQELEAHCGIHGLPLVLKVTDSLRARVFLLFTLMRSSKQRFLSCMMCYRQTRSLLRTFYRVLKSAASLHRTAKASFP
jgi:phosphoribosylamine--glycine ligase